MFTTDSRTESFLQQLGVTWRYTNNIKQTDLRPGWDANNLGRPVAIRDDAVSEYAALTQSGSQAPAPVLIKTPGGFDVLDGVQRICASQLCCETCISAYVVECDSDNLIATIRVLANARLQGRAEPMEWTRRRAVEILVIDRGMTVEEVARLGGWRKKDIEEIATAIRWRNTIAAIGGPDNISDAMISVISSVTTEENLSAVPDITARFLNDIKQSSMSAEDAEPHIEAFFEPVSKSAKLHATYQGRLEEFRKDPEIVTRLHGRKGSVIPSDIVLRRTLKSAIHVLEEIIRSESELKFVDEFFQLTKLINDKLHELSPSHKKKKEYRVPGDMYQ